LEKAEIRKTRAVVTLSETGEKREERRGESILVKSVRRRRGGNGGPGMKKPEIAGGTRP